MKIQLTKTAKAELKELNARLAKQIDPTYDKLKKRERLLCDAQMYVNEAYINNKFKHLDDWCLRTGQGEFQYDHRMSVKKNIGKMLMEDIITIVE